MLKIKCLSCYKEFWVEGYTTPDSYYEPGEIIINETSEPEDACRCYLNGDPYTVIEEEHESYE